VTPHLLVLSLGDPAGIGPELLVKAAHAHVREGSSCALLALAPLALLEAWRERCMLELELRPGDAQSAQPGGLTVLPWPPVPGHRRAGDHWAELPGTQRMAELAHAPCGEGGLAAWASLACAVDLVMEDPRGRALVTAPISKAAMARAAFRWPGHTEYLGWRAGVPDPLMWMDSPSLSIGLVSNHDPLFKLEEALKPDRVEHKILLALARMRAHHPLERLAVLALNPHAGDEGQLGMDEVAWLGPLVERLRGQGLPVDGPLPADSALARGQGRFLAMYHDQGLPLFKHVAGLDGVNVTLGLPFIRTSPDHGTAFDVAGKGVADARSMLAALRCAEQALEAA
jgi:4-hydroxythreonine-4-phosphate dehydrogenase